MLTRQASINSENECIYASGIKQSENLHEYHNDLVVDFDYEESVRNQDRAYETASIKRDRDRYNYNRAAKKIRINLSSQFITLTNPQT